MQRDNHEVELPGLVSHPAHSMDGGLMRQLDWLPLLRAIFWRNQVEHRSAVDRIIWIPFGSDRDLRLAIAINVGGGDAYIIEFGQILRDDKFLPLGIPVPNKLFLVRE